jgi:hypothetical protein
MGVFGKSDPTGLGSKSFFTQIPGTPPFLGGFEAFWTKSNLGGNVKKKWFHPLPFLKKWWFLKNYGSDFFSIFRKNALK